MGNIIETADITAITIPECRFEFYPEMLVHHKNLYYKFKILDENMKISQSEDKITLSIPYTFAATTQKENAKAGDQDIFFHLDVTYSVSLVLDQNTKIDEKGIEAFTGSVLPRILHPYFRQTVSESLQKAGLPQLNLPLYEKITMEDD